MAVYAKCAKFMASVGAGATWIRKTFSTEAPALAWEASQELTKMVNEQVKASRELLATC